MFSLRRLFRVFDPKKIRLKRIIGQFRRHQQELQENCIHMAASGGKPRGLRWSNSQWLPHWVLVEDTSGDLLTMFQSVNLSFEAIEGGDMEDVSAVSMVRDATGVFHFQNGRWGTGGRVLFNMNPKLAAETMSPDQTVIATEQADEG